MSAFALILFYTAARRFRQIEIQLIVWREYKWFKAVNCSFLVAQTTSKITKKETAAPVAIKDQVTQMFMKDCVILNDSFIMTVPPGDFLAEFPVISFNNQFYITNVFVNKARSVSSVM